MREILDNFALGIVETLRESLLLLDENLRVVEANSVFYRTFQVSPQETRTQFIYDLGNSQWDIPELRVLLEEIIPQKTSFEDFEVTYDFPQIGRKTMLLNACRLRRERDDSDLVLLAIEDITSRKKAEESLAESEARFRALVHNSNDVITVIDSEGIIVYESPSVERILGYTPEERIGTAGFGYAHPDMISEMLEKFAVIMATPETTLTLELPLRHKDGSWRWMEITGSNQLNNPAIKGIVVNSRDVTDRMEAQIKLNQYNVALERSNEDLQQFAYVASHDLQEPLRAISGYLQLLQRRHGDQLDEQAQRYIQQSVSATVRMQTLIGDLLQYSRVQTHGQPFELTHCGQLIEQVLTGLSASLDETGATVTFDTLLPEIVADSGQLARVFQNLIGNAVKFHGDQTPHIHLSADHRDNEWLFTISDNGIGIEAEYFERIFVIFQRLHTRREYPGTGIGLAICKRIIERHNGRMWVESQPGIGSTFFFTISDKLEQRDE